MGPRPRPAWRCISSSMLVTWTGEKKMPWKAWCLDGIPHMYALYIYIYVYIYLFIYLLIYLFMYFIYLFIHLYIYYIDIDRIYIYMHYASKWITYLCIYICM
jgi:hypothetical protein